MPDDHALLEDLIDDGKIGEARRVLEKISPETKAEESLRYAIAEQLITQAELGENPGQADLETYLGASIKRWERLKFADKLLELWLGDLSRGGGIEAVWFEFSRLWEKIPKPQQTRVTAALVRLALAQERADLAAAIFEQTHGGTPRITPQALELSRLYRLAGMTAKAVQALENATGPAVTDLRIALLRELNANDRALVELLAELEVAESLSSDQIELLVAVARGAGQPGRAVPWIERYLQSHPESLAMWRALVVVQRESGEATGAAASQAHVVTLSDRAPQELREWGRLLEGSGQPHEAFDAWSELSLLGDRAALDRLMALNPGLYRDRDLAEVLLEVVPVENHDDYTLTLARMLTGLGRYDESVEAYEAYFEAVPVDTVAMLELAVLQIELYRYDEASRWLQRIKMSDEAQPDTRRKLADAWAALGEFELALAEYRAVAEATGLMDDYGSYFRLARGLGSYEDFVSGLEGVVSTAEADASNYLTLAYGYQLLGEETKAKQTLRDGMARFPENAEMPMRLAYAYSDAKQFRVAQEVVELHPGLGTQVEPTRLYLLLMRLNNDTAAEKRFLERQLSEAVINDPESKQTLARIYLLQGELETAEKYLRELHADLPDDWDVTGDLIVVLQRRGKAKEAQRILAPLLASDHAMAWQLAASVASELGNYADAEVYQTKYLAMVDPATATDWGALGDIRLSRGDVEGSKRAYRRALRAMQLTVLAESKGQP